MRSTTGLSGIPQLRKISSTRATPQFAPGLAERPANRLNRLECPCFDTSFILTCGQVHYPGERQPIAPERDAGSRCARMRQRILSIAFSGDGGRVGRRAWRGQGWDRGGLGRLADYQFGFEDDLAVLAGLVAVAMTLVPWRFARGLPGTTLPRGPIRPGTPFFSAANHLIAKTYVFRKTF